MGLKDRIVDKRNAPAGGRVDDVLKALKPKDRRDLDDLLRDPATSAPAISRALKAEFPDSANLHLGDSTIKAWRGRVLPDLFG